MSGGNSHQRAVTKTETKKKSAPDKNAKPPQPTPVTGPDRTARLERLFASISRLKKTKAVVALLSLGVFLGNIDKVYRFAVGVLDQFSDKLKIEETVMVFHEPWFYVLPTGSAQPIPMWTWFYLTLHSRESRNIWISDYLATAHMKDRDRWIQLMPPPLDVTFRVFPSQATTLKRQDEFNYNAASGPIAPDGYLKGWVFFETCLAENVDKIEFEFHDKEGKTHRVHVGAGNAVFGGQPGESATPSVYLGGSHPLEFDEPTPKETSLSPPTAAYVRRIRPYLSLFPGVYRESFLPGQIGVEPCSKWIS